jgi:hypothetical protein
MARYVESPANQMVEPAERWVKIGGVMRNVTNRYRRMSTSTMQETWPLVPGPPGITSVTFPYQNDRIELAISWTAPTSGAPVTSYAMKVEFRNGSGALVRTDNLSFGSGTLSTTLNKSGAGYQSDAGLLATVTITPSGVGGAGTSASSSQVTVPQLPAPPAPTYNMSVTDALANHTWSHVGGNRVTGVELQMSIGTSGTSTYNYGAGTTSVQVQPWDPNTVFGGWINSKMRTVGPGGASDWVTVTGSMPTPPTFNNFRFLNGWLRTDIANLDHQVRLYYYRNGWVEIGLHSGNGAYNVPGSDGWPRDNSTYCHIGGKGYNQYNGWTGRWSQSGGALKIPNPYYIWPSDSDTWRNGWMGDTNLVSQGNASGGQRTGSWFYGTQFTDWLHQNRIGYYITPVSGTAISIYRKSTGGSGQAKSPRLWVHGWATKPGGRPDLAGGVDTTALLRGQAAWCPIDTNWVRMLIDGTYRGVGMFHPDTWIDPSLSTSLDYLLTYGYATYWGGHPVGTIGIWHDG